ncbi:MAG: bifunctional phosphoglucose/phosphomannose isomerase [Acidimicrobiales bacterium]
MKPDGAPDSLDLWGAVCSLPEQVAEAAERAADWVGSEQLPSREQVEHIVVLGMGGSGITGDVLLAAASPYLSIPVVVVKSYVTPAFVSDSSLVFAVSFSGDTEETVEAATEALGAGARMIVVTGGGQLRRLAERAELPCFEVPSEIPQPRAALGALAIPPLAVLEAMGLFPGASRWIEEAIAQLRRRRDQLVQPSGPAAEVARRIGRTIPLVESSRSLGAAAAQRWKTQVNENAKRPAFWSAYPEACHNEVVGWGRHPELSRELLSMVHLRHETEHPQVSRRFELVTEMIGAELADVIEVRAEGEGELAQLLDLVIFGDLVSLHLAAQEGLDPGPVDLLDELKRRLRKG